MNVQTMEEVVLWVAWFTCLGFLHLLVQLCKDRFEYVSYSKHILPLKMQLKVHLT